MGTSEKSGTVNFESFIISHLPCGKIMPFSIGAPAECIFFTLLHNSRESAKSRRTGDVELDLFVGIDPPRFLMRATGLQEPDRNGFAWA
jgi:hypothetical protein